MFDEVRDEMLKALDTRDLWVMLDIVSTELPGHLLDSQVFERLLDVLYDFCVPNELRDAYRAAFIIWLMVSMDVEEELPTIEGVSELFEGAVRALLEACLRLEEQWWQFVESYSDLKEGLKFLARHPEEWRAFIEEKYQ